MQIVYLDDEVHQHIALECLIPDDWEIFCYDSPMEAIEAVTQMKPALVISDQRMPQMQGFKFLEMVKTISPESVRIITTGYNDENSIVESIRAAQIYDYIIKPWDAEKLLASLERAMSFHQSEVSRVNLTSELQERNQTLESTCDQLNRVIQKQESTEKELECWIPPVVSWANKHQKEFPMKRDLALMAIDIVGSGALHDQTIGAHTLRQKILVEFSMLVVKHGGYVEAFEGDAAYANFGLKESDTKACHSAFAVATEFRAALKGLESHYGCKIDCGIALHFCHDVKAMVHEYSVTTLEGVVVQKKFFTESPGIDLVHRIEKMTHKVSGSNIIMTKSFTENCEGILDDQNLLDLGSHMFKGQQEEAELFLISSHVATENEIDLIKKAA